jgi:hypothetical protein
MANTGIVNGGDILLYMNTGTDVSPVWTPIAHATEHTLAWKTELRDRVTKNTGAWRSRKAGIMDVTINVSGLTTYDGYGYADLLALAKTRASVMAKYAGRLAADVTAGEAEVAEASGDKYEEGTFIIESVDRSDGVNADSTFSAVLQSDGEVETKTVGS